MADWIETYYDLVELGDLMAAPIRQKMRQESWFRRVFPATPVEKPEEKPHPAPPSVRRRKRG